MKTSIKLFALATAFAALLSSKAEAQTVASSSGNTAKGIIYSVGIDGGYSLGNFKDTHKWSVGGSLQADIPVVPQFFATINAGYSNFFGRNDVYGTSLQATDIHLIPVKAGLKYFPISYLYVQADAGAAFVLNKSDVGFGKTAAFIYAPQVGVQLPIAGSNVLDLGAYYQGSTKFSSDINNSKINYIGLRVAYGFSLK